MNADIDRLDHGKKAAVKKILIVDDNAETPNALFSELSRFEKFRVLSTNKARITANLLKTQKIDTLLDMIFDHHPSDSLHGIPKTKSVNLPTFWSGCG